MVIRHPDVIGICSKPKDRRYSIGIQNVKCKPALDGLLEVLDVWLKWIGNNTRRACVIRKCAAERRGEWKMKTKNVVVGWNCSPTGKYWLYEVSFERVPHALSANFARCPQTARRKNGNCNSYHA